MKTYQPSVVIGLITSVLILHASERYIVPSGYAGFQPYIGRFSASIPIGDGKSFKSLETRTTWSEEQNGIRFETWEERNGVLEPYNSGLYVWNEAKADYDFHETRSDGSVLSGSAKFEGKVLLQKFTMTRKDGVMLEGSVISVTAGSDTFTERSAWLVDGKLELASEVVWQRMKPR